MDEDIWEDLDAMAADRGTTRGVLINFLLAAGVADWKADNEVARMARQQALNDEVHALFAPNTETTPVRNEDTVGGGTSPEAEEKAPEGA